MDFGMVAESFETSAPWDRVVHVVINAKQCLERECTSMSFLFKFVRWWIFISSLWFLTFFVLNLRTKVLSLLHFGTCDPSVRRRSLHLFLLRFQLRINARAWSRPRVRGTGNFGSQRNHGFRWFTVAPPRRGENSQEVVAGDSIIEHNRSPSFHQEDHWSSKHHGFRKFGFLIAVFGAIWLFFKTSLLFLLMFIKGERPMFLLNLLLCAYVYCKCTSAKSLFTLFE